MTLKVFRFLLIAGFAGYLALFFLFNRTNPATNWQHQLDRHAAIVRARELAMKFGVDTTGWTTLVRSEYDHTIDIYSEQTRQFSQQSSPPSSWSSLLSPTNMQVKFADLRKSRSFEVRLNAHGDLLGVRRREPGQNPPPDSPNTASQPAESKSSLNEDQGKAEVALAGMLGNRRGSFSATPTSAADRGGREFTWIASDDRLKIAAEISVQNGMVTDITLNHSPTTLFRSQLDARRTGAMKVLSNSENIVIWPAIIGVIIAYFIAIARKQINHRETLRLLLLAFLFFLTINLLGSMVDGLRYNFRVSGQRSMPLLEMILPWVIFVLANALLAMGVYLFHAAGCAFSSEKADQRTLDLSLLLRGKLLTRPVAESLFTGLLSGGLICAIPLLIAASGIGGDVMLDPERLDNSFSARFPAFVSFTGSDQYLIVLIFSFLLPLIQAYVKKGFLTQALTFGTVWLTLASVDYIYIGLLATVLVTTLLSILLLWLYWRFGILSMIVSLMSGQAAMTAASLLAQPAAMIQHSGWRTIAGLAVALIIGALLLWKARDVRTEELALISMQSETRAERERLKAEFDVARRAQQHMLPDEPPNLSGFNIAAICNPSKEVGGDLYDFLRLRDGKIGIVVADVSGKGVPASLYMTLTKGLLESVSEDKTDPGEILKEVNRHLYEVCRRKMFVTLVLGVLDPAKKTLTYARAGHNPTVFRSASEQRTTLLKSRGMGLGLNSGKLFDGSIRVETLALQSRDKLFFYSDGITEAMNAKNEEYGEERLMAIAAGADEMTADQARDKVLLDVKSFLGDTPPQDDQTLVVVEVT